MAGYSAPTMSRVVFRVCACCLLLAVSFAAQAPRSPGNQPWPPGVQKVSADSPALAAEDALKTFYMPPGYHVELVASEPLIQEPVALDWDLEGRLWAVEMPGFMADIRGSNEHDPIGRVVVLEDTNSDGRMDKRTVFADGLVLARSLKVLDRGILVAEPPNVWLMRDTNGDLRVDTKERITDHYGRFEGDPQNNANGFYWGLDNRMYTAGQSNIQLRLKDGVFEVQQTLSRGEWGVSQDDGGRTYRNTNESALHVDLVQSYGTEFAQALEASPAGEWRVLPSREGSRVIRLQSITSPRPAVFENLGGVVLQDWADATMAEQRTAAVRVLAKKYKVEAATK